MLFEKIDPVKKLSPKGIWRNHLLRRNSDNHTEYYKIIRKNETHLIMCFWNRKLSYHKLFTGSENISNPST